MANKLIERLPKGSLLILSGDLGAGKTTLVRLMLEALGSDAKVSSPTYTLIHEYPSPQGVVVHIDAYRLGSERLLELALDDYLARARLVVVEWGEALRESYGEAWFLRLEHHPQNPPPQRSATLWQADKPIELKVARRKTHESSA
ncbi:MAG: tRNA (adenosine(37)-N6)-threonylcarbamoyltransferase complex ATPase subunit type 1 TsaE [Deinococcales bacterium]